MQFPLYIVDAFTINDRPFSGNPAGVCFLEYDDDISDEVKQKIASEVNLSETAFVAKAWAKGSKLQSNSYTLRWFTPNMEVKLCGHATLGSARAILEWYLKDSENIIHEISFETKFNRTLKALINSSEHSITLDFPVVVCKPLDRKSNPWVEDIIKYTLGPELNPNLITDIQYSPGIKYLTLVLTDRPKSEELIRKLSPDFAKLLQIDTKDSVLAVQVTQKAENPNKADFLTRFFAPWAGIGEDPVCGSGNGVVTPYWKNYFDKNGICKTQLIAEQCSQRGGTIVCQLAEDRVKLTGKASLFVSGFITI